MNEGRCWSTITVSAGCSAQNATRFPDSRNANRSSIATPTVAVYSKGTNVGSTVAAVKGLSHGLAGRIWLIAGGEGKGQDFVELAEVCEKHPVAEVLLFGADRKKIQGDLAGRAETSLYETLDEAVEYAAEHSVAGDIVLLSPACASFDQFRNYVHRGEHYCQCVEGLE